METTETPEAPPIITNVADTSFMKALTSGLNAPEQTSAPETNTATAPKYSDPYLQEAYEAQQAAEAAKTAAAPANEVAPTTPASETKVELTTKEGLDAFDEVAPEPAAEKTAEPDEEPPAGVRTKEAREAWKSMREGAKKASILEKQVAELNAKLEKAGKITDADPIVKKAEALEARLKELEPVVARVAYQKTEAYQNAVTKPMNRIGMAAKDIFSSYSIPDDKAVAALQEPDRKRQAELIDEVCESMNSLDKGDIIRMAGELRQLYQLDDEMQANAAAAHKEAEALEAQTREQAATEKKAAEMRAVVGLKPKLLNISKILAPEGTSPETYAEALVNDANSMPFDEQPVEQKAYMSVAARLLKDLAPAHKNALAKIKSLEAQVAGMSAARPGVSGTPAPSSGQASPTAGFMEAFGEKLKAMGMG